MIQEKVHQTRMIETKEDQAAYVQLCKDCFETDAPWTDSYFPLQGDGSFAMGRFSDNGQLQNAAAAIRMNMQYYGESQPVTGVSAVASNPANRGQGDVQTLLAKLLRKEYQSGRKMAFLYPFNHSFYNKTGFGSLNDSYIYEFAPENIKKETPAGEWEQIQWSQKLYQEMVDLNNQWSREYQGSVLWPFRTYQKEMDNCRHFKSTFYLYRRNGELKAWLCYSRSKDQGTEYMDIYRMVWDDSESFRAIFSFLFRYRTQIHKIRTRMPDLVPLRLVMKDGHIKKTGFSCWMGRPLDVEAVLRKKLEYEQSTATFSFSLEDPVIQQNTGTYLIENGELRREEGSRRNLLPFHLASALILGGVSLYQLIYSGILNENGYPLDMYQCFSRYDNLYISEMF